MIACSSFSVGVVCCFCCAFVVGVLRVVVCVSSLRWLSVGWIAFDLDFGYVGIWLCCM